MRRLSLLAGGLLLAGAAGAQVDGLPGLYRPPGAQDAGADLQVTAEGRGWLARFRGEGLALLPVPADDAAQLFPQADADASLQCAVSPAFMFCRARPGARIDGTFSTGTGAFTAIRGGTYQDLAPVR